MTMTETKPTTVSAVVQSHELIRALKNASLFVSSDKARPVLTAIEVTFLNTEEIRFAATDSYALFVQTISGSTGMLPAADTISFLLEPATAKAIIAACKADRNNLPVEISYNPDTSMIDVRTLDQTISARAMNGQYPNWREIVDRISNGSLEMLAFGADLLGRLSKVTPAEKPKLNTGPVIKMFPSSSNLQPARFEWERDASIYAILMPVRVGSPQ